jgi:hypothetical protein
MAVFIEKPPVTSSNSYETRKNASILIKLGTNDDWTIAFVTTCSVLNFLLPWQQENISKLPQNHYFASSFSIKIYFKVLQLLKGLRWSQRIFSVGYTVPYERPGAMRGTSASFKPPKQKGAHPSSGDTLMYLLDGGRRLKSAYIF